MKPLFKIAQLHKTLYLVLVSLPVIAGLTYAFLYSIGAIGILNTEINFSAWTTVFSEIYFWKALLYSLYIAIVSVGLSVIFSFLLAYYWRENFKKGILSSAIYLPLCFSSTVMAFFMYQMLSQSGFLSRATYLLHLSKKINDFPVLINDTFGIGIILTMIVLITPFFIILFSNIYNNEKIENLATSAITLGASKKQIISKIVIPVIFNKSKITLLLFVLFVMGNYEVPLLLGGQNPQMISVLIVQKIQRFNLYDIPQGYVMSILYLVLILLFLMIIAVTNSNFFKHQEPND